VSKATTFNPSYFSVSTRINGSGNGKFEEPSTSVLPSKVIAAVAVAKRCLRLDPGKLTVVTIGPVPVQRASTLARRGIARHTQRRGPEVHFRADLRGRRVDEDPNKSTAMHGSKPIRALRSGKVQLR